MLPEKKRSQPSTEIADLIRKLENESEMRRTARITGVKSAPQRPPRSQARPRTLSSLFSGNRRWLIAGLGLIAFVAVYEVYKQFAGQAPQAADASNLEVVAPAGLQDANNGSAQPQAGGAGISKEFRKLLVRRLQTQGFSDLLVSSGRPAKFQPVSALRLPEPGKAVTVTVLLYSPLDAFTETWWRKVGMLKSAAASGNPFLRSVTIESQEALDCLVDWHVEGFVEGVVTIKPPALESEPQGNSEPRP